MKKTLTLILLNFFIYLFCHGQGAQSKISDPKRVQFVTSDIPHFWAAFDSCKVSPQNSIAIYNQLYFNSGSQGLKTFEAVSIKTSANLVSATEKYRLYYESIRQRTLQIKQLKPLIQKDLIRFKYLYPQAMFPNVYFLMGDLNSGGKSEKDGLLIGAEVNCADSASNFTNIYPPFVKTLKKLTLTNIPNMVIHELVHYQQSYVDSNINLLGYAIKEGSADFICKLITGSATNDVAINYGEQHEKELWVEFKTDMNGYNISKWLYNSATSTRPADLGYYIGFEITQSYYLNSKDKQKAINQILNIKDFDLFLKESKYEEKFN